jgi:hypothetical protein
MRLQVRLPKVKPAHIELPSQRRLDDSKATMREHAVECFGQLRDESSPWPAVARQMNERVAGREVDEGDLFCWITSYYRLHIYCKRRLA